MKTDVAMDKFFELSFINYTDNTISDDFTAKIDELYALIIDRIHSLLNKDIADELENDIMCAYIRAMVLSGVEGMKVAVGVMDGSIVHKL